MTEPAQEKPEAKRRPTPKQWVQAETLWEMGDATLEGLAAKLGVSESAVSKHMARAGVVRCSKSAKVKARVVDEVAKAAAEDAAVYAGRIRETKEDHYKMASGLAKLAWAEILKAKNEGIPMSAIAGNLKSLDAAMTVLTKARSERWAILGLDKEGGDDDDGLPELVISELTDDQVKDLRDRDFNEFEELGEVVVEEAGEPSDGEVVED
jgi:hypothetical protein